MSKIVRDLDCVWINFEKFSRIGYQGLQSVNTITYVESPTRSNDGSIDNINDYETFVVPRVTITFPLLKLEDYQRLCHVVSMTNEFPVTYWDKQKGEFVTHNMYCEPEQMKKLFNIGYKVVGVLDFQISFIGTLNDLKQCEVVYFFNSSGNDSSILSSANCEWGRTLGVISQDELQSIIDKNGLAIPTGKHFAGWNTRRNGSGFTYIGGTTPRIFDSMNLYAMWE